MTIPSGTKLGRYEIGSQPGAGGRGEVYVSHDPSELGRPVALKILTAEVDVLRSDLRFKDMLKRLNPPE